MEDTRIMGPALRVYGHYNEGGAGSCFGDPSGPGFYSWMDIKDSESELLEFYDRCNYKVGWTRWQRFKMWLFRKWPKITGYDDLTCSELDNEPT